MKNLMIMMLSTLVSSCAVAQTGNPEVPQFIIPIAGTYLEDYFLVNYVDWSVDDIDDYLCGNKTYEGHQGTDFVIKNFAQMDAGVDVLAADDGVVTFVLDTLYDRNKTAISGGLGNYVAIRHANNYYTYYGHLKTNSVPVQVGQHVFAGQVVGQVGSSGYSSDPHLHFEVWYDSLYNWDPFAGTCGNGNSLWLDTLPYIHTFGEIDHDLTDMVPTLDTLKERIPGIHQFSQNSSIVTFWMQGYGAFEGDVVNLKWFDPQGNLWFQFDYVHPEEWWYYYWWSYIDMPPPEKAGQWSVHFFLNGELKIMDIFEVLGTTAQSSPVVSLNSQVFQTGDELVLTLGAPLPFKDEVYITDMLGQNLYRHAIEPGIISKTLPLYNTLLSGVYVLYSKHGSFKPCRFTFVR